MPDPIQITYVTASEFKQAEVTILSEFGVLADGSPISEVFAITIRPIAIREALETDLERLVLEEVEDAYGRLKLPCVVEHAGLVFDDYADSNYPGGLTKPMWNVLGSAFIAETQSAGRSVTAKAAIGYCDGMEMRSFTGETHGTLSAEPRGSREFYWDTVFIPDEDEGGVEGKTYAEIAEDARFGINYKVLNLSQSTRAMCAFLEYRRDHAPALWPT